MTPTAALTSKDGSPEPSHDVFTALANITRRALLDRLREEGPQPVAALAANFAMRRPSVSEHLRVLRLAGLVVEQRQGRQRVYALRPEPLGDVARWLDPYEEFWRGRLGRLRALLDAGDAGDAGGAGGAGSAGGPDGGPGDG